MPEDSKKNQHKGKHEAKDQRKPKQSRQHAVEKSEKKSEKRAEEPKASKPVYEEPGPEFYKNLKRETDEILKITEEANAKYKKKEIKSNWTKYEMPIESYEEIEEQENLGADYEKLIQAPLSIGGHFQFKHEKSWDVDTAPSLYDKYFEINMDNLATAINTVPFFVRNCIDQSIFSETDMLNMKNRAERYKKKYYNETTPKSEALESIINSMRDTSKEKCEESVVKDLSDSNKSATVTAEIKESKNSSLEDKIDVNLEIEKANTEIDKAESNPNPLEIKEENEIKSEAIINLENSVESIKLDDIDELLVAKTKTLENTVLLTEVKSNLDNDPQKTNSTSTAVINPSKEAKPVLESPEDLEKWLDDFLDG